MVVLGQLGLLLSPAGSKVACADAYAAATDAAQYTEVQHTHLSTACCRQAS